VFSGSSLVGNLPDVFNELLGACASLIFSGKQLEKL
jgi:hypothetical protein